MKFLKYSLAVYLLLSLPACAVLDFVLPKSVVDFVIPKGTKLNWRTLTVVASNDANLNTAIALDVVLVRDDATLAIVAALPASKWFSSREELKRMNPNQLLVRSVEVAPGQTLRLPLAGLSGQRVAGAFVFGDYLTPGEHRQRVEMLQEHVLVQALSRAFTVVVLVTP